MSASAALGSVLPVSGRGRLGQGSYVLRSIQVQHWKRHAAERSPKPKTKLKKTRFQFDISISLDKKPFVTDIARGN